MLKQYYIILSVVYALAVSHQVYAEKTYDMEGMTVIGNKETPTHLYIVPWEPVSMPQLVELELSSHFIDSAMMPVDRKVLVRRMMYNEAENAPLK